MDALIMSCSTGGGHNSAAAALKEELERRGHCAVMLDPYRLAGKNLDRLVGNGYIKIAQKTPRLFGAIYKLGDEYRRLPIHSPVYALNIAMAGKMEAYLEENRFDVIFMTHIYPGEMLAYMQNSGYDLPKRIFIATDYVCVPFTEETQCDYYVTPAPELNYDFVRRKIPDCKLVPAGIPVSGVFSSGMSRDEAITELGLDKSKRYLLMSGGSIGAGLIEKTITVLVQYLKTHPDYRLIVICGNNKKLYRRLTGRYRNHSSIFVIGTTQKMAVYMRACDAFLSKPGGLSSTEAAVSGTPLIHISPIPGCETKNMKFFEKCGMSIAVANHLQELENAIDRVSDTDFCRRIKENQSRYINKSAASDICTFAEKLVEI